MAKIVYDKEFFNITDTLECGQIFRFKPYESGYLVFSGSKVCYAYENGNNTVIECNDSDKEYFYAYFDLDRDYRSIVEKAIFYGNEMLSISAQKAKGIRILQQDKFEMLISFVISQNNNIPRIKSIIEKLCLSIGEKNTFNGVEYYAFPTVEKFLEKEKAFYTSLGLGYRDAYILETANVVKNALNLSRLESLPTAELKKELLKIKGIGEKVANCIILFGFNRFDSFPVDTWIEKVYTENFNGKLKDRKKITEYFVGEFKENSGIFQQYLFHYKRSGKK